MDLIEEFRLRVWARSHYVPANARDRSWHNCIIDEMQRMDREQVDISCTVDYQPDASVSTFVPLAPSQILKRHDPHSHLADPNLLKKIERLRQTGHRNVIQLKVD